LEIPPEERNSNRHGSTYRIPLILAEVTRKADSCTSCALLQGIIERFIGRETSLLVNFCLFYHHSLTLGVGDVGAEEGVLSQEILIYKLQGEYAWEISHVTATHEPLRNPHPMGQHRRENSRERMH
jgi:hypothetical protein